MSDKPKPIAIVHVVTRFDTTIRYIFETQWAMDWAIEWFRDTGRRFYIEWTGELLNDPTTTATKGRV